MARQAAGATGSLSMPVRDRSLPPGCICAAGPESTDAHGLGSRFGSSRRRLNTAACRVTFCVQDQGQESRGQWWPGPHSLRDLAGCGPVFLAGQRGSAGGVAFADLGDEGLDGGEGEVRAVAEDGVTRPGKSHEAGGAGRQLAG